MARKRDGLTKKALPRGLSASLAGIRAGGALALDSAIQKIKGADGSAGDTAFAKREAQRFVTELGQLKGTYVKIGQMMALFGEHFLPPVLAEAMHDLGDQTEPLHWDALESAVRDSLGSRFDLLDIDSNAIAAASLAQVHLAKIRSTGQWICLKIQYPGVKDIIDADFDAVVRMLMLARWVKVGRDLDDWLESMREHLHHEVDYHREAELTLKMKTLAQAHTGQPVVYCVPQVYKEFCTDTVLALEYMEGLSVTDQRVADLSQQRRNALAQSMLELFLLELYQWGCLQTDPNFGNYLLNLDDRRKRTGQDEMVLLDFGSVLECSDEFLHHLRHAIDAGLAGDIERLHDSLKGLGCLPADATEQACRLFTEFCLHLLEPLQAPEKLPQEFLNEQGQYCWARSRLMRRVGKRAALSAGSRHFTPPTRDFGV